MPIIGKTDAATALHNPLYPVGFRVYAGEPKQGNKPGRNLQERFRVEFEAGFKYLEPLFIRLYGSLTPERLDGVVFPYQSADSAFDTWNYHHVSGGLVRKCDGETIVQQYTGKGTGFDFTPQPCIRAQGKVCECKARGQLKFMLSELVRESGVMCIGIFWTSSANNIPVIHSALSIQAQLTGLGFRVPFTLYRYKASITKPVKDGRGKVDDWLVGLTPEAAFMRAAMNAAQLSAPAHHGLLESGSAQVVEDEPSLPERVSARIYSVQAHMGRGGVMYYAIETEYAMQAFSATLTPFKQAGVLPDDAFFDAGQGFAFDKETEVVTGKFSLNDKGTYTLQSVTVEF